MRKVYRRLTKEQRARGVVFASTLSAERIEQPGSLPRAGACGGGA